MQSYHKIENKYDLCFMHFLWDTVAENLKKSFTIKHMTVEWASMSDTIQKELEPLKKCEK